MPDRDRAPSERAGSLEANPISAPCRHRQGFEIPAIERFPIERHFFDTTAVLKSIRLRCFKPTSANDPLVRRGDGAVPFAALIMRPIKA
jgi:hypothetical protein